MAITLSTLSIQVETATSATPVTFTGNAIPTGSLIIICWGDSNTTGGSSSFNDSASNTYVLAKSQNLNNTNADGMCGVHYVAHATALTSGQSITCTPSSSGGAAYSAFYATGCATTSPLDTTVTASAFGSSTAPSVTAANAPAVANSLILGFLGVGGAGAFTQDSTHAAYATPPARNTAGLTPVVNPSGGTVISSSKLTYAPTIASHPWTAIILGFSPPALNASPAITGVAATGSIGTAVPNVKPAATGVAATGSAGSVSPLTGVIPFRAGIADDSIAELAIAADDLALGPIGVSATGSAGTVLPSVAAASSEQYAFTQIGTNSGKAVASVAITLPANIPAGCTIFVAVAILGNNSVNIADSFGQTHWVGGNGQSSTAVTTILDWAWNAQAMNAGNTITVSAATGTLTMAASAFYATGLYTAANPFDSGGAANTFGTGTSPFFPGTTSTFYPDLLVATLATDGPSTDSFTQDASFASNITRVGTTGGSDVTIAGGTFVTSSTATRFYAPTITSRDWAGYVASFRPIAVPMGVQAVGSAGSPSVGIGRSVSLTGVSATGQGGTATAQTQLSLIGVSASGSAGSETASANVTVTGASATGSAGTGIAQLQLAVTGAAATGSAGTSHAQVQLAVIGVSASGTAGSEAIQTRVALFGAAGTGQAGTESAQAQITLAGASASGSAGTLSASSGATVSLIGAAASTSAGSLSIQLSESVNLTGAGATTAADAAPDEVDLALTGAAAEAVTGVEQTPVATFMGGGFGVDSGIPLVGTTVSWTTSVDIPAGAIICVAVSSPDAAGVAVTDSGGFNQYFIAFATAQDTLAAATWYYTVNAGDLPSGTTFTAYQNDESFAAAGYFVTGVTLCQDAPDPTSHIIPIETLAAGQLEAVTIDPSIVAPINPDRFVLIALSTASDFTTVGVDTQYVTDGTLSWSQAITEPQDWAACAILLPIAFQSTFLEVNEPIAGINATTAAGSLIAEIDIAAVGASASTSAGTITAAGNVSIALVGASATSAASTATVEIDVPLTGASGASQAGSVTILVAQTANLIGASASGTAGSIGTEIDLSLAGASASTSAGTVTATSGQIVALSGAAANTSAGAISTEAQLTVSGASGTSGADTEAAQVTVALLGAAGASQASTALAQLAAVLTGATGTTAPGAFGQTLTEPLTGAAASTSAGAVMPITGQAINLNGASCTTAAGALGIQLSSAVNLAGATATTAGETISAQIMLALSGTSGASAAGALKLTVSVPLIGAAGTSSAGHIALGADQTLSLTGASVAASAGGLYVALSEPLNGAQAAVAAGTLAITSGSQLALTGAAATSQAGQLTPLLAIAHAVTIAVRDERRYTLVAGDDRVFVVPPDRRVMATANEDRDILVLDKTRNVPVLS